MGSDSGPRSPEVIFASELLWILSFIGTTIIVGWDLYFHHFKKLNDPALNSMGKLCWYLGTFSYICFWASDWTSFYQSIAYFSGSGSTSQFICDFGWKFSPAMFMFGKISSYLLFVIIMRMAHYQWKKIYQVKQIYLQLFCIYILFVGLLVTFFMGRYHTVTLRRGTGRNGEGKKGFKSCKGYFEDWVSIFIAVYHLFAVSVIAVLYFVPVFGYAIKKKDENEQKNKVIKRLITHIIIGSFSTFIFQFVIATADTAGFQGVDIFVQAFIQVLIHKDYKQLYRILKKHVEVDYDQLNQSDNDDIKENDKDDKENEVIVTEMQKMTN